MTGRDLFVSTFAPRLGNGRDLRTHTVIRALAAGTPLDVLYVPHGGPGDPALEEIEGLRLHQVVPSRGAARLAVAARMRALGWTTGIARSCSPEVRRVAETMAAQPGRGRVIVGDLAAMAMLMPLARRRPVVYNAHNVESSYGDNPYTDRLSYLPMRTLERRVLRAASESWMVSHLDVEQARAIEPGAALRYVPNVVDVSAIEPAGEPASGDVALMVGDYTYPPNRASAQWLVSEVMPLVWAQRPQARVRFVGKGLELEGADPRVEIVGWVDSLPDAYAGAAAVLVPLVEGAGTPLKFVEALAYAMPVVATPLAARGLDVVRGEHFRCGGDAEAFAGELVDVLAHGDAPMARRARELAEREYSVEALTRILAPSRPVVRGGQASGVA